MSKSNDKYTLSDLVTAYNATKIFCDPRLISTDEDRARFTDMSTLNYRLKKEIYNKLLEYNV